MFHRFAKWFDSVTDGWNPIVVRELRRTVRAGAIPVAMLFHLGLLIMVYFIGQFPDEEFSDDPLFFEIGFLYVTFLLMFAAGGGVAIALRYHNDELLDAVPLTPKDNVHGHLYTSCILSAFFLVQSLPFMLFPPTGPFSVLFCLGSLTGIFIVAQILSLSVLSFFIRTKTIIECIIAGFLAFALFFGVMMTLVHLPELSIVVASIGGVLALLSFTYLAYRLSLHHFANRSKSCWRAMFVNLGFYLLWSSFWAVVAFVVVLCFV